jgi:YesN/AraC family two-component response regulator
MPTTLIVDDDLDMRLLIRLVIEMANEGLRVVGEASDGLEALEVYEQLGPPEVPDVVILDNRMPNMTGLEAAEEILRRFPDQVVILYSAFLDAEVRKQAAELGIALCLTKNEVDSLPDRIHQLTGPAH